MRLNKFLATAGVASRRKCDEIILSGKIEVNGKKVNELGLQVDENKDIITFNGKGLQLPSTFVYLKINKPKGYICSNNDDKKRKTIYGLVNFPNVRLFSVGRLDYETEGLLILTNDGNFAHKIIHPSSNIEKEYICKIEGKILESELAVLRNGVVEKDGTKLPKAKVEVVEEIKNKNNLGIITKLSIKISEGKNRQIRRMFEGIGRNIVFLKRIAIGELKLGGLNRGEYKLLTEKEKKCFG